MRRILLNMKRKLSNIKWWKRCHKYIRQFLIYILMSTKHRSLEKIVFFFTWLGYTDNTLLLFSFYFHQREYCNFICQIFCCFTSKVKSYFLWNQHNFPFECWAMWLVYWSMCLFSFCYQQFSNERKEWHKSLNSALKSNGY